MAASANEPKPIGVRRAMKIHEWEEVKELLHEALRLPPEQRTPFLDQACSSDDSLRAAVESLLRAEEGVRSSFLQSAPQFLAGEMPARIGRYRIIRLLGQGGMGAVYEAEQDQPRRSVALKVVKGAWAGPERLRRFEREFQTLGRLRHPGIAQIYDAGSAETGFGLQPFFAMELIDGKPLTQYAEAKGLSTRQRLTLMIQICEAAQYAHQRGIIHRDLKPDNILVEESGQPKILDFGLARATGGDEESSRETQMGQLLGTLPYMSPEQMTGDPLALDTRSDVYALGVILYQLLAGRLPYQLPRQLHEAAQALREVDPAPLSSIDRAYRGDIETIVAKALEKDKERRYASAAELAADIQRYLDDRPIAAKPASGVYQLRKFTRRHRSLAAGLAAVLVVLVAGVVASGWEAVRARREAASAQAVNDFLQHDLLEQANVFSQSALENKPDPDLKVRTVLDRAAQRIQGKFDKQPEVEAAIRSTIGSAYDNLGLDPEARIQVERALELRRDKLGAENPKTLETMDQLSSIAQHQGKFAEAEVLSHNALELQRRMLGPKHPDTLRSMANLARVYRYEGKYEQAEALYRSILTIGPRVFGAEDRFTFDAMYDLAVVYWSQGKHAKAEALDLQALEISRRVLGPEHPDTLLIATGLASVYNGEGKYAQAEDLGTQILAIDRRTLGPEHPATLDTMAYLAGTYTLQGRDEEAEALDKQVLEIRRRVQGIEHPTTLVAMGSLAYDYLTLGRLGQSEALFLQTLSAQRRISGAEHPDTLLTLSILAYLDQIQGKYDSAAAYAAQALAGQRKTQGAASAATMDAAADLALANLSEGKFAQSEPLAREAVETDRRIQPDGWQRFRAESLLGASLAGERKYAEAEPLLLDGYQGMLARKEIMDAPNLYHLNLARTWIVQLYQTWGKPAQAAEWKRR